MVNPPRILIVSYQEQGHLNPALHLAKRLAAINGVHVTFLTSLSAYLRMAKASSSNLTAAVNGRLSFSHYSDGYKNGDDSVRFFSEIKRCIGEWWI